MTIKTKLVAAAFAVAAIVGSVATISTPAQAGGGGFHHHHHHPHFGLLGAAAVGTAIAVNNGYYYDDYRRCRWVPQFDVFGRFVGRVRACRY